MAYTIGIDEVGRGPLAGPVVVVAAAVPTNFANRIKHLKIPLRDSKKLSESQRKEWIEYIKTQKDIYFAIARVYPKAIDTKNISRAANSAAERAYKKLIKKYNLKTVSVYLDGGLYIGSAKKQKLNKRAQTIIKGDEKIPAISVASIIAKVHRDRLMVRLAKKYPKYGLGKHKGYGTREHLAALKKYGPTPAHRLTFLKKYPTIIRYGRSSN